MKTSNPTNTELTLKQNEYIINKPMYTYKRQQLEAENQHFKLNLARPKTSHLPSRGKSQLKKNTTHLLWLMVYELATHLRGNTGLEIVKKNR
jgi:hypothetical protein